MATRSAYRRHSPAFKEQVCREIRSGRIGRREAKQLYDLSDNLIHQWLLQFDRSQCSSQPGADDVHAACNAKIHALERKIGELVMALDGCRCATTGLAERAKKDEPGNRATPAPPSRDAPPGP